MIIVTFAVINAPWYPPIPAQKAYEVWPQGSGSPPSAERSTPSLSRLRCQASPFRCCPKHSYKKPMKPRVFHVEGVIILVAAQYTTYLHPVICHNLQRNDTQHKRESCAAYWETIVIPCAHRARCSPYYGSYRCARR